VRIADEPQPVPSTSSRRFSAVFEGRKRQIDTESNAECPLDHDVDMDVQNQRVRIHASASTILLKTTKKKLGQLSMVCTELCPLFSPLFHNCSESN